MRSQQKDSLGGEGKKGKNKKRGRDKGSKLLDPLWQVSLQFASWPNELSSRNFMKAILEKCEKLRVQFFHKF